MSSVNSALTSNRFATLLNETHVLGKPQGYLCCNSVTKVYNVYLRPKQSRLYEAGFSALSFREIVFLSYSLYSELSKHPEDANIVANEIRRMNERKVVKERNQRYFFQVSGVISDCSKNLFKGYGFKTTSQLAIELSWDLFQIAAKAPKPLPVPSSTAPPVIVPSSSMPLVIPQSIVTVTPSVPQTETPKIVSTNITPQPQPKNPEKPLQKDPISSSNKPSSSKPIILKATDTPQNSSPTDLIVSPKSSTGQNVAVTPALVPHKVTFSDLPPPPSTEIHPKPVQKQLLPSKSSPNLSSTSNAPQATPTSEKESTPLIIKETPVVNYSSYTRLPDRPPPIQRSNSRIGKKDALKAYKEDPINCPNLCKTSIWLEINEVDNERPLNEECITSVVHLMLYVSNSKELDLKSEKCGQVVVDTFSMGKKIVCSNLVQWLKKKHSFNPALLEKCLLIFIQKAREGGSASALTHEPLIQLLQIYKDRKWNSKVSHHSHHHKDTLVLPINSPILVDSLSIVLANQPNNEFGTSFVEWASSESHFDAPMFIKLIRIYKDLEELKGANLNDLYYPTRDKLIEFINANSEIKSIVLNDGSAVDMIDYLRKRGVHF